MKIGVVGFGNRIAHVFHELKQINPDVNLVAYVDPQPIGKAYAAKNNFFPKKNYQTLISKSKIFYERHIIVNLK